jgi:thioredoxin-related protein
MNQKPRLALPLALFLLSGTVSALPPAETKTAPTPAAPQPQAPPLFDPDAIGEKQIAEYQKVCLDSGRRLLIVFGTDDCAACRAFNAALHKNGFFEVFINQFVPVFVDVSNGGNASLLVKYNINTRAPLPAIVMLMPDGRIIEELAQGEMSAIALQSDAKVQEFFLNRFLKAEK